jgi:DNA-binding XRE family transcriptional regulator
MDYLYVCQFSNGHIKVGRSVDPQSRIASHAERVSCLGVELAEHATYECNGPAGPREAQLIARCVEQADKRFQNEWFTGLDFLAVCEWAREAADSEHDDYSRGGNFGSRLRAARIEAGLTQTDVADAVGVGKAAVSSWESGRHFPKVDQLEVICTRVRVSADRLIFGQQMAEAA